MPFLFHQGVQTRNVKRSGRYRHQTIAVWQGEERLADKAQEDFMKEHGMAESGPWQIFYGSRPYLDPCRDSPCRIARLSSQLGG
jgi:hypothetical protein